MAFDKEKVRQKIADLDEKINAETDPRVLNEYRILFRRGFSFFRRSWAAAYLLMLYDQGQGLNPGRDRGPGRSRGSPRGERAPSRAGGPGKRDDGETGGRAADSAPRVFLAEEESRRLFISVGRNRRVFPREILGLIITRAQVDREDIGIIRILDSYSFVQVRDTVADRIIEALNGTVFRGRPMTANYARLKREEGSGEDGAGEAAGSFAVPASGLMDGGPPPDTDTYAEAPPPDDDYPVDSEPADPEPVDPESADPEPEGDYPGDSEQGDDQDDEEDVQADTSQEQEPGQDL
jgi:hypothetical protein